LLVEARLVVANDAAEGGERVDNGDDLLSDSGLGGRRNQP
jgi:hypothetical protein